MGDGSLFSTNFEVEKHSWGFSWGTLMARFSLVVHCVCLEDHVLVFYLKPFVVGSFSWVELKCMLHVSALSSNSKLLYMALKKCSLLRILSNETNLIFPRLREKFLIKVSEKQTHNKNKHFACREETRDRR